MKNVLILGASGMLGSMLLDLLSRANDLAVTASVRDASLGERLAQLFPTVRWVRFRYERGDSAQLEIFREQDWIINAIGITKPLVRDDNADQIENAIAVNSQLPHEIGRHALDTGAQVLQIATDCVFSGTKGAYTESDAHDALDVYGKTKSLGECYHENVHHLRCSIIGPEPKDYKFLIEWFCRQPRDAQINGFTNHRWNGVTTLHFARLCQGIIRRNLTIPHLQHLVPTGILTKAQMLHEFAVAYNRQDVRIIEVAAKSVVDRTLGTNNPNMNAILWEAAGYQVAPTIQEMIQEAARYAYEAATA
jgi:dTDP-4-dehydrorhamnose reductase